jgi:hypothetical protein
MSDGRWVESDARWFEMQMRYCVLCGQVIPSRFWRVETADAPLDFCAPACETLYRSYLMKRPGS